jgi:hypothetical protein
MTAAVRYGTLLAVLVLFSVACDRADRPTAPSLLPTQPPSASPPPPPAGAVPVPPLSGPVSTYHFSEPLSYPVRDYTITSRYLLYDNGAFALQYGSTADGQVVGIYTRENGRVTFDFSPVDRRWMASGTLNGDSLEVRYNDIMEHSDFENAVYRRAP